MDFLTYLAKEGAVIWQAPVTFLIAVVLAGLVAYALARWAFSTRMETLNERLRLRDDEIGDYKRKLDGATPDAAKALIENLQLEVERLKPRRITQEQREQITEVLSGSHGRVNVMTNMSYMDGERISEAICWAFANAGWVVSTANFSGNYNPPPSGFGMLVGNAGGISPTQRIACDSLRAAGIRFDVQHVSAPSFSMTGASGPADDLAILITAPRDP